MPQFQIPNPFEALGRPNPFLAAPSLARMPVVEFAAPEAPMVLPKRRSIREILTAYDERGRLSL